MMKLVRLVLLVATVWCGVAGHAQFFYEASCNDVEKYDVTTGKHVATISLASRTSLFPDESPRTAFCDIDNMKYDAARSIAIVEVNDGRYQVFRRLVFTVPQFRLVSGRVLSRKWHDVGAGEEPATDMVAKLALPGMSTDPNQRGWLMLDGYQADTDLVQCTAYGQGKMLLSTPVESAGDKVILRVTCAEGTRFLTARGDTKQIMSLNLPLEAGWGVAYTTSDARYLLIAGRREYVTQGGDKAWLVDLQTSKLVGQWTDPRMTHGRFLGFARNGNLLFLTHGENLVLKTGLTFQPTPEGDAFFADR
ncbi:hypothetical protein FTW19_07325 [Terriglobus albidus]|uniref:Uncharacterized protein n=1 Tax=Terriglobus albidus TaxID=1592106 RepID=A0A5B9E6F8_9BACT|nr:hypothetical protein [Terriglobus albidus]QEE27823.1 hypothetical protein FTW19_07325 [Terriglobus albidus]